MFLDTYISRQWKDPDNDLHHIICYQQRGYLSQEHKLWGNIYSTWRRASAPPFFCQQKNIHAKWKNWILKNRKRFREVRSPNYTEY